MLSVKNSLLLFFKEALTCATNPDPAWPSMIKFLLQDYRDVLPMDASHILLGRPCQSDPKVVYAGL